jgi:spore maturation protein CgeB
MKVVFFVHSIISDWNNGHAHFLRGLVTALIRQGHEVLCCERVRNWSTENLVQDNGVAAIVEFGRLFAQIRIKTYRGADQIIEEVDRLTEDADLVLVHEFNEPETVSAVGYVRNRRRDFFLLFHDTHHRAVSVPDQIARLNLAHYDGVLAFGESLADIYRLHFGVHSAWVFHEAADTTVFRPLEDDKRLDMVWIGNWGDDERSAEIYDYLIDSARLLKRLRCAAYGVRYPDEAISALADAGIIYKGWTPNFDVPRLFARAKLTIHLPRNLYRHRLPGIPTIRPFEALACGIPLISTAWADGEGLFRAGKDYLVVESPEEMRRTIVRLAENDAARARLAANGLETIRARHTCDHRAQELAEIYSELSARSA